MSQRVSPSGRSKRYSNSNVCDEARALSMASSTAFRSSGCTRARNNSRDNCSSGPKLKMARPLSLIHDSFRSKLMDQNARFADSRSEERRVGKECRSRWWTDQEKKKKRTDRERRVSYV